MDMHVSKDSDVPLRQQVAAQLEFLIATRRLKPGDALPSVRSLARQLGVHHNTVSQAYQDLVQKRFLIRRRGSRMVVRDPETPLHPTPASDVDHLISGMVRTARQHGYTLQQLYQCIRERMLEEPPDRILALSTDSGMRVLFQMELSEHLACPVEACSPYQLIANPSLAIGALIVSNPGPLPEVLPNLPKNQTAIPIIYSGAKEHLEIVRRLQRPSLIAVVSISEYFLGIARGVLGPVVGQRHSLLERLLTGDTPDLQDAADIVFCDSIAYRLVRTRAKAKSAVLYRLIAPECLNQISSAMGDRWVKAPSA